MNNLLFNEPPLVIPPSLAVQVGLNEAIILQQLHYWLQKSEHQYEDRKWVYNSYPKWQEQFPFWHTDTVKRTITKLEKKGIILSGNFNKLKMDKTKWYTINYELLGYAPTMSANCTELEGYIPRPIPETTTETNNKIKYAEFVKMKESEYQALVVKFKSEQFVNRCIEVLDNYKGSTGKKYKDDYRAILSWVADKVKNERPTKKPPKGGGDLDGFIIE